MYNCVVKIPVSRSANRCYTHGLPNDIVTCKECRKDDARLKVVKELSESDQLLKSFTEEICKDLPQVKPEQDIWVEVSITYNYYYRQYDRVSSSGGGVTPHPPKTQRKKKGRRERRKRKKGEGGGEVEVYINFLGTVIYMISTSPKTM